MTEQLLGVFAVWLTWTLAVLFITAPQWAWYLTAVALGIGWELLVNPSTWWLGLGVGGAAAFLVVLTDLFLVLTDWTKVTVLRQSRSRL
jgi:hypothetical protein